MRLQATVECVNCDVHMCTKPTRSSLALGKKPQGSNKKTESSESKVFLMLCTAANRTGIKFDIQNNIKSVFDKHIDQGKCTIQFIKPHKMLMISKADPVQLKALRNMLKKVLSAKTDEELDKISTLTSAALNPASMAQVTKPKEKLIITEKKDYPITKNFPSSLAELRVNGVLNPLP